MDAVAGCQRRKTCSQERSSVAGVLSVLLGTVDWTGMVGREGRVLQCTRGWDDELQLVFVCSRGLRRGSTASGEMVRKELTMYAMEWEPAVVRPGLCEYRLVGYQ